MTPEEKAKVARYWYLNRRHDEHCYAQRVEDAGWYTAVVWCSCGSATTLWRGQARSIPEPAEFDSGAISAMVAMSNVMRCAADAAKCRDAVIATYEMRQRGDTFVNCYITGLSGPYSCVEPHESDFRAAASREWSAAVRRGVQRIKPSGPVVVVDGDED